jgi:hypothetical protein
VDADATTTSGQRGVRGAAKASAERLAGPGASKGELVGVATVSGRGLSTDQAGPGQWAARRGRGSAEAAVANATWRVKRVQVGQATRRFVQTCLSVVEMLLGPGAPVAVATRRQGRGRHGGDGGTGVREDGMAPKAV